MKEDPTRLLQEALKLPPEARAALAASLLDSLDPEVDEDAESAKKLVDELRPEYDLSQLKGGVRGKYYKRAIAGTNLVLIEPDLAKAFPDTDSVNRALRTLLDAASLAAGPARRR